MPTVKFYYTRKRWNPISWLIRWALPRSRFALALSSHVIIGIGETFYEATMLYGVRRVDHTPAFKGQTVVLEREHHVPNLAAGVEFLERQLCTYRPKFKGLLGSFELLLRNNYDWGGAFGLLSPDRNWAEEGCFWCYELAAAFLHAAGRNVFANLNHVGETALMAIEP